MEHEISEKHETPLEGTTIVTPITSDVAMSERVTSPVPGAPADGEATSTTTPTTTETKTKRKRKPKKYDSDRITSPSASPKSEHNLRDRSKSPRPKDDEESEKKEKKEKKPKEKRSKHPPFLRMAVEAIKATAGDPENELVSYKKITQYIATKYSYNTDDKAFKNHVKAGLNSGVRKKKLIQVRASYKLKPDGRRSRSVSPAPASPKRGRSRSPAPEKSTSPTPRKKRGKKETADVESPASSPAHSPLPTKPKTPRKKKERITRPISIHTPTSTEIEAPVPALVRGGSFESRASTIAADAPLGTIGVVFNTTDITEVRTSLQDIVNDLLKSGKISIAIIANRGITTAGKYNLETLDFTTDAKAITGFVENAYGEGPEWIMYYKQVLEIALTSLTWSKVRNRSLILIGDHGVGTVSGNNVRDEVGKLNSSSVNVYAFHHSQLFLLNEILATLH